MFFMLLWSLSCLLSSSWTTVAAMPAPSRLDCWNIKDWSFPDSDEMRWKAYFRVEQPLRLNTSTSLCCCSTADSPSCFLPSPHPVTINHPEASMFSSNKMTHYCVFVFLLPLCSWRFFVLSVYHVIVLLLRFMFAGWVYLIEASELLISLLQLMELTQRLTSAQPRPWRG